MLGSSIAAATISLTVIDPPSEELITQRTITLSPISRTVRIGRHASLASRHNALFRCAAMSKDHAEFSVNGTTNSIVIRDLNSTNGTTVNGTSLGSKVWTPLSVNDEVVFGKLVQSVSPCAVQINSIELSFSGDAIEYPIYIESDDSDSYDATSGDDSIAEENLPNYRATVSKRRNICENGPNVDLGTISGDVHSTKRNTSRPDSVEEEMAPRKRSISTQSDGDPIPPTKRRRLQRR
ncbi:hypothetical protein DL98DRAFT_537861 [Cadophora sp. DSE1049]|nr:hypothetical protein DL98DRAFT_537861 [Cadophora sp. DSE1049]